MLITSRRILSVEKYLNFLPNGSQFQVSLTNIEEYKTKLLEIGFSDSLKLGERVLPKIIGPITRFNANGFNKPQRDQPMEILYREAMIQDWNDDWHHVYIPYKRYPRKHIAAPSVELTIESNNGSFTVTSPALEYNPNNPLVMERIKHVLNLFLELFGQCIIESDVVTLLHGFEVEKRNWRVLPAGEYPWQKTQDILKEVTKSLSVAKQRLVNSRFEHISQFNPTKLIIGQAGFDGYVVFCFEEMALFVLESRFTLNATYVFGDDWEGLSQLSKSEILNGDLYKYRYVHHGKWAERINGLLGKDQAA